MIFASLLAAGGFKKAFFQCKRLGHRHRGRLTLASGSSVGAMIVVLPARAKWKNLQQFKRPWRNPQASDRMTGRFEVKKLDTVCWQRLDVVCCVCFFSWKKTIAVWPLQTIWFFLERLRNQKRCDRLKFYACFFPTEKTKTKSVVTAMGNKKAVWPLRFFLFVDKTDSGEPASFFPTADSGVPA